jgi:hypothetical protein
LIFADQTGAQEADDGQEVPVGQVVQLAADLDQGDVQHHRLDGVLDDGFRRADGRAA